MENNTRIIIKVKGLVCGEILFAVEFQYRFSRVYLGFKNLSVIVLLHKIADTSVTALIPPSTAFL